MKTSSQFSNSLLHGGKKKPNSVLCGPTVEMGIKMNIKKLKH